ncbi:MAG: hypothetical protein ACI8ZB_003797 [Desulforhopalus sp.]
MFPQTRGKVASETQLQQFRPNHSRVRRVNEMGKNHKQTHYESSPRAQGKYTFFELNIGVRVSF